MSWPLVLQAVESFAVAVGVLFGLIQLRQLRLQREIQAGIELLHPLQAPRSAEAILEIHSLPDGLLEAELKQRLGDRFGAVMGVLAHFESLGPLVARGHVPIEMYAESYRGITILAWKKFRPYIEEQRAKDWPIVFEWLQWLAERMEQRAASPQIPAFDRFKGWAGPADYNRICAAHQP